MTTGEDGCEDLFDDFVLTNDNLLQLLLHDLSVLTKFFEDVAEVASHVLSLRSQGLGVGPGDAW